MAFGDIILPPHLAPWQQAGVQYLLRDAPLPPEQSLLGLGDGLACTHLPPTDAARRTTRQQAAQTLRNAPAAPVTQAGRAAQVQSVRPGQHPPAAGHAARNAAVAPHTTEPPAPPRDFVPPEHWPPLWHERLTATSAAPVLWTYFELGEDFYGTPDPARRGLLQRLLRDMGHPAGTHRFWPCALPSKKGDNALVANPAVFWSGVRLLKARFLVVLGERAFDAMNIPPVAPLQFARHGSQQIIALRDAADLVNREHHYAPMLRFLRSRLSMFG